MYSDDKLYRNEGFMKRRYQITFITELGICRRETDNIVTALAFQKILKKLEVMSWIAEIA